MLLVYSPKTTNRIRYGLDVVLNNILKLEYDVTNDEESFQSYSGPKFSYSNVPLEDELFFEQTAFMTQRGIKDIEVEVILFNETKCLFPTHKRSELPYDPFCSAFYLVSRYEEYLPHIKDQYGRYKVENSIAFKNDFLHQAVVDRYAIHVKEALSNRFPEMVFPLKQFEYIPTYDIDSAYAYLNKGILRNVGGLIASFLKLEVEEFKNRWAVLTKRKKDPFDTFKWQVEFHKKHKLKPIYFFLIGDYDEYDKNISYNIIPFRELIKSIGDHGQIGIHPSYASNKDPGKLKLEKQRLEDILNREVVYSRQHFLKLHLPETYKQLMLNDIKADFTMGYPSVSGFRAGTCTPFYFYDIESDSKTNLKIYPFPIMDATYQYYLKNLRTEALWEHMESIIDEVHEFQGCLISLWHNNSLSNYPEWNEWRELYVRMVKHIKSKDAINH